MKLPSITMISKNGIPKKTIISEKILEMKREGSWDYPLYFVDDVINDVGKFCIGSDNAPLRIFFEAEIQIRTLY